jgi:hypothetical protein
MTPTECEFEPGDGLDLARGIGCVIVFWAGIAAFAAVAKWLLL